MNKSESGQNGKEETTAEKPAETESASNPSREEQLLAELEDEKKKYLYLYAEFENFKKRAVKERSEVIRFGWEPVARDLLGVMDNLHRAIETANQSQVSDDNKALLSGLELVAKDFRHVLESKGVKSVEALGQEFDPNLHEAVGQAPSPQAAGTIIHQESRGYTLHGRLLRPARVIVSAGKQKE